MIAEPAEVGARNTHLVVKVELHNRIYTLGSDHTPFWEF